MFGSLKKNRRSKKRREKVANAVLFRQGLVGLLLFCLLGGIIYSIWYVTRLPSLTLNTIDVTGGVTVSTDEVKKVADETLAGTYYKLVPRRFAWTYPALEIQEKVEEINKIKNASVERLDGNTVVIVFQEYNPYALWCSDAEDTTCLFLADEGYAFAPAPLLSGTTFLRYFASGKEPVLGVSIFSPEFLRFVQSLDKLLDYRLSMNVLSVEKIGSEEAIFRLAGSGELKVTMRQSPEETLENLLAILSSEEFSHLGAGDFQYIDLRFGNKVFVNEEDIIAPGTTSTSTITTTSTTTLTGTD